MDKVGSKLKAVLEGYAKFLRDRDLAPARHRSRKGHSFSRQARTAGPPISSTQSPAISTVVAEKKSVPFSCPTENTLPYDSVVLEWFRKENFMSSAKLTSKGQITIPRDIRQRLGLRQGDRLEFVLDETGRLVVQVLRSEGSPFGILQDFAPEKPVSVAAMRRAVRRRAASKAGRGAA